MEGFLIYIRKYVFMDEAMVMWHNVIACPFPSLTGHFLPKRLEGNNASPGVSSTSATALSWRSGAPILFTFTITRVTIVTFACILRVVRFVRVFRLIIEGWGITWWNLMMVLLHPFIRVTDFALLAALVTSSSFFWCLQDFYLWRWNRRDEENVYLGHMVRFHSYHGELQDCH